MMIRVGRVLRRNASASLLAAGLGAAAPAARAADGAVIPLGGARSAPPAAPVAPRPEPAAAPAFRMAAPLRHPDAADRVTLPGERASATFRLWLPEGAPPREIAIAHRVAITALPERSRLTVFVNGTEAGSFAPASFDELATATAPTDALRAGDNEIRIETALHHRIYCGPEASYGLWTEIGLAASGATLTAPPPPTVAGFLAAAHAQGVSGAPLEMRVGPGVEPAALRAVAARIAQATEGRAARLTDPWEPAADAPPLARVAVAAGDADYVDVVRGGDGAPVLRVVAGPVRGSASGLAAALDAALPAPVAAPLPALAPGRPVPLSALGAGRIEARGRLFRAELRFALPQDWLALASERAELTLSYAHAADLPRSSALNVAVNGATVQLLPLDRDAERPRAPLRIPFKASLLRPGVNTLSFETLAPGDPPGLPCAGSDDPVATVFETSTISVPTTPSMRAPGMRAAVAALDGSGVTSAAGGGDAARLVRLAPLFALRPAAAGRSGLTVALGDAIGSAPVGDLPVERGLLAQTLSAAPPLADGPDAAASEPAGPVAAARALVAAAAAAAFPGDPPLRDWLAGRRARAILLQPERSAPGELWLLAPEDADIGAIARAIDRGRRSGDGPAGHLALLADDGTWSNWTDRAAWPVMAGGFDVEKGRATLGIYASWAPVAFTAGGVGFAWLSAICAMVVVRLTRSGPRR
jgi:hypothetical protein